MGFRIGEVAGFLDITPDTIRYYEKEGILHPLKNRGNGYREYTFEDISRLSDILFYRDVDFSLGEIREIMKGTSREEMLRKICEKEAEIAGRLAFVKKLMTKIQNWELLHSEALAFEGRFDIRPMETSYHKGTFGGREDAEISALTQSIPVSPEDAYFVTLSFSAGPMGETPRHYFALDTQVAKGLDTNFNGRDFVPESHPRCLFTVCQYRDDLGAMLAPVRQELVQRGLPPPDRIYGRQSVVTYENDRLVEWYRIFAPLQ